MEKERKVDVKKLWESLEDLVVKTVISGESPMSQMCRSNLSNRYNAYELFGIDVLFDEYLKPWILEVIQINFCNKKLLSTCALSRLPQCRTHGMPCMSV